MILTAKQLIMIFSFSAPVIQVKQTKPFNPRIKALCSDVNFPPTYTCSSLFNN